MSLGTLPLIDYQDRLRQYRRALIDHLWRYRRDRFDGRDALFDRHDQDVDRPPVFLKSAVLNNILIRPGAAEAEQRLVHTMLPAPRRNLHFGSMLSSQALTQTVFGNLVATGKLAVLADLTGDDGRPLFLRAPISCVSLDHPIKHLREPRATSVDVFFAGTHRTAVECKLSETEVGTCSRPRLKPDDPQYCDGNYVAQRGRHERCSLTSIKVAYWRYVPQLFHWSDNQDHRPCPLRTTYQLVRNVLAAAVWDDGTVDPATGHAVLLYDERNPAFQRGGKGWCAYDAVRAGLRAPALLQSATWQQVGAALRDDPQTVWLAQELHAKYGL